MRGQGREGGAAAAVLGTLVSPWAGTAGAPPAPLTLLFLSGISSIEKFNL